jgi:hypothetical protein
MLAVRIPTALCAALVVASCAFSDDMFGPSTAARASPPVAVAAAQPVQMPPPAAAAAPPRETRKPFVVIRFEEPDPDFDAALYEAVSAALKRRPDAAFDLVAVTRDPDAAQRNLRRVLQSLREMGMPAERLTLSAAAAADNTTSEVWIYLR